MRKKIFLNRENPEMPKNMRHFVIIGTAFKIVILAGFLAGCAKDALKDQPGADSKLTATIAETSPANLADTVYTNSAVAVTFKSTANPSEVAASTITLQQGTTLVPGTVSYSATMATFTPSADLKPDTRYTATIKTIQTSSSDVSEHSWSFTTGKHRQENALSIVSVVPLANATLVPVSIQPSATFSNSVKLSKIKAMIFTLKQGTTTVEGSMIYEGKTATFIPKSSLAVNTVYTVTISSGSNSGDDDEGEDDHEGDDDNQSAKTYTWSFTTGDGGSGIDVTAPTIISAVPANNATGVANSTYPEVTFSEAMNATTINSTNFTLKQGATAVAGTVAYSGYTATFTPATSLMANTVYTASITTGAKDVAGNAIASIYTWSFTTTATADVTAPTVLTIVPASGATSIAVNSDITATFSEAMNASTITSTTFTLKQGTISVAGLVSYSGTTATFNPAGDLTGNTVYTATITTGSQDLAGNAITTSKVWSFTTVATATVVSFSTQVMPILQGKCTPCHGANNPSAGISITNFATVSLLSNTQLDNANMYPKMGVTPAEQAIIKAWIAAGRPNN